MTATFTRSTFANEKQIKGTSYPWKVFNPSDDDVRRYSWGLMYKDPRAFAMPVENPKKGKVSQQQKQTLETNWGVTGAQDAYASVDDLLNGEGFSSKDFLLPLLKHYMDAPENSREDLKERILNFIEQFFVMKNYDASRLMHSFRHFSRIVTSETFSKIHAPAIPTTTAAWDILRVHSVGGASTEVDWISEEDFLKFSDEAVAKLQHYFTSWADVANSFWWGRFLWACDGDTDVQAAMGEMTKILTELVAFKDSPWVRVALRPKNDDPFGSLLPEK